MEITENSQIGKYTYITLDIETDPIWLDFENQINVLESNKRR